MNNFALIIGTMKGGTTSLFAYLAQHPQISPCRQKEPRFFSNDQRWAKGFEGYQTLWDWHPQQHKVALEASVDYTRIPKRPNVAARIATLKDQANFKFIYILRNPWERIESHYTHGHALGWIETQKPLSEGIDRHLIEVSQYARQIDEYYQRFDPDSILLLNFDDLKRDPLSVVQKVCHFLNIDTSYEFQGIGTVFNANNQRLTDERLWKAMSNNKFLRSIANLIPLSTKKRIYNSLGKKRGANFKISPEQRQLVFNELREDMNKLSNKYGFDVSKWTP